MGFRTRLAVALTAWAAVPGCYSSETLIAKAKSRATQSRVDEVDVGDFRVTLPRDGDTGEMAEIEMRVFGEVERYKLKEVRQQIEERAPQIEDRIIGSLREVSRADLADPALQALRDRVLTAINAELPDDPLHAIGFYDIRFVRH